MILSHRHKFIFFCNGKTGSTSIEAALRPYQEGADYDFSSAGLFPKAHVPPAILRGCLPERVWREYFKFVFVRNPWDWFVSSWHYNAARPSLGEAVLKRPSRALHARAGRLLRRMARGQVKPVAEPLMCTREDADYLYWLLKRFRGTPSAPTCMQTTWAYDVDGARVVDYVGRFENLEADFAEACRQVGIQVTLPHLNRTEHHDYRSCFTAEGRRRVAELWEVDVRNFGYTF